MSRSKRTGSAQKAGSGSRHISGKSPNTPTRKGGEEAAVMELRYAMEVVRVAQKHYRDYGLRTHSNACDLCLVVERYERRKL